MSPPVYQTTHKSEHSHPGPLDCHLSTFAMFLLAKGYSATTVLSKIQVAHNFSRWLDTRAIKIFDLDDQAIHLFFKEQPRAGHTRRGDFSALCTLLEWLRELNQVQPSSLQVDDDRNPCSILSEFGLYLKEERGLSQATLHNYLPVVSSFLNAYSNSGLITFSEIHIFDITRFIMSQASNRSRHSVQLMTSALRSFFRFLRYRGDITLDLAASIPAVADWKMSQIPKYLAPDDVEQLLKRCDQTTQLGKRDYGVLLLLARLGLRARRSRCYGIG